MRRKGTTLLFDRLFSKRGGIDKQTQQKIAELLLEGTTSKSSQPLVLKGVHRGRFHRIKLEPSTKTKNGSSSSPSKFFQLPNPGGPFPHAFKSVTAKAKLEKGGASYQDQFAAWWKENWPTVVLNLGSVATLIGFTRSDVLELRMLSVTGSLANVIFNFTLSPRRYLPSCWSFLFASVNAVKIKEIVQERHQRVQMTPEQEDIYVQLLMPHGITPRQFQVLEERAEKVVIHAGEAIIRQGEEIDHVKLVVSGSTRASISGRRLTAASAICPKTITEEKAGGNSGAWIGEMSFLETYWKKEEQKKKKKASTTTKDAAAKEATLAGEKTADAVTSMDSSNQSLASAAKKDDQQPAPTVPATRTTEQDPIVPSKNRYTIVAASDCVVW